MTYLEIILQLDNVLIVQLTAYFLSSQVRARSRSRIGKVSHLEQLQKCPCNSDIIAEAHRSAQWSVYWRRHFCCSYQIPRRGVECSCGYLPMHLGRNKSNVIKIQWFQKLRVILGRVRTESSSNNWHTFGRKLNGGWKVTNTSERKCCRCLAHQ